MINIQTINTNRRRYHVVKITRKDLFFCRYFPFSRYGGEEKALDAANVYLDTMLAVLPPKGKRKPPVSKRKIRPQSNSKSGLLGVSPVRRKGVLVGYEGRYVLERKKLSKHFSISRCGSDVKARAAAWWFRLQMEIKHGGWWDELDS